MNGTTPHARAFDGWIRGEFATLNTALEEHYFAQPDRADTGPADLAQKSVLLARGERHISCLLSEGNTDQGFDSGFDLLGNVGLFMAACRRHGIAEDAPPLRAAAALALHVGASLGVTPRFATSHLTTHNRAVDGCYRSFTTLADERLFLDYNTRGVLAYKRAADALMRILPMGVSHPVAADLFSVARDALREVAVTNRQLADALDIDRFFYCVRPYYKPVRVGLQVYRGANAGDFAGINIIDLLLGLCGADRTEYSQLLVDKFLYMMPDDQALLRDCMRRQSLLDALLAVSPAQQAADWYRRSTSAFLEACAAHAHAATQHHDLLVSRFIVGPSRDLAPGHHADLTASGPPLPVLLRGLEWLRDMRCAADRADIPSRHADLARLRRSIGAPGA